MNEASQGPERGVAAPGQANSIPPPNGEVRRRRIMIGVYTVAAIAACVFAYWLLFMKGIVYTDDARFGGHMVDIAPEISGRLIDVTVHEGMFAHKGAVVVRLDPAIPRAKLDQAEALLVSARANLASAEAIYERALNGSRPEEIKAAEETVRRLEDEEAMARLDFDRAQALFKASAISQNELDRARTTYESAQHSRENAVQTLILLQKGPRKEDIAVAKAAAELAGGRVKEAQAAADNSRSDLERCTVKAPFDGWVVRRWLDPGAMPLAAQPVISMFDPASLRVDANIEEQDLHDVAVGDRADITVDAFPSLRLHGRVTEVMRAVNAEFSIIPAEGVSGTFIKVTQRVPLRIAVAAPPDLAIGPGLSVEVRIHSGTAGHE